MRERVKQTVRQGVKRGLATVGLTVQRAHRAQPQDDRLAEQRSAGRLIQARHAAQTLDEHALLTQRLAAPVFGDVAPWELVTMLGQCVDPTDSALGNASQLTHVLQILDAMRADGIDDEEMLLAAVVHDLGKVLLLTGEDPENVVCMNKVLAVGDPGDPATLVSQWNHDEFVHMRLAPYLSAEMALVIRHHSVMPDDLDACLDRQRCASFLARHRQFFGYDQGSKSTVVLPRTPLHDVRELVGRRLPPTITF